MNAQLDAETLVTISNPRRLVVILLALVSLVAFIRVVMKSGRGSPLDVGQLTVAVVALVLSLTFGKYAKF